MSTVPSLPGEEALPDETCKNFFQCGTCSKSYSRVDHLSRHVRTHTQEKPYQCQVCGKKFGRIDLLSRHASLHNSDNNQSSSRKRRRGASSRSIPSRTSQACVACAENHLRCDDKKPCGRCQRKDIACVIALRVPEGHEAYSQNDQDVNSHPDASPGRTDTPAEFHSEPAGPNWLLTHSEEAHQIRDGMALAHTDHLPAVIPPEPNVVVPGGHDAFLGILNSNCPSGIRTPRNLITFGLETDLDLSMVDLTFLESYNSRNPFEFEELTIDEPLPLPLPTIPTPDTGIGKDDRSSKSSNINQKLIWRFVPAPQDHGFAEHDNLLLPEQPESNPTPQSLVEVERRTTSEKLDLSSRDKILGIFLRQLKQSNDSQALSFPSVELLDSFIQYYLTAPFSSASSWLHVPTFSFKKARPELLLAIAAAGAVLAPDLSLRKLGYAMQEVLRHQLTAAVEADNTVARNLEMHQAFYLYLEIGLWSGNSRKIEIAESIQKLLVSMVRRGGMFHQSAYPPISVQYEETRNSLEEQWRSWIKQESFKRIAIHLLQHDAQTSKALLSPPLISYAEVSMPLPASPALWDASSAAEWFDLYCKESTSMGNMRIPTVIECVANLDLLDGSTSCFDLRISCEAVLHAIWGIVWEYRQFHVLLQNQPRYWDNGLVVTSRYQELSRILDCYRIAYEHESGPNLNITLLHMHASMADIHFLTTLEPQDAHPVRQSLYEWSNQKESRQALWHASQVIKQIKLLPVQHIRDFVALSLYNAALTIWAYGIVRERLPDHLDNQQALSSSQYSGSQRISGLGNTLHKRDSVDTESSKVFLDSEHTDNVNRYIALGRGMPVLHGIQSESVPVSVHEPREILDLAIELMEQNYRRKPSQQPPIVVNLIHVFERLKEDWK